ncbi:MAG: HAD family hydrolase [Bacteroidota bacterium]
MKNKNIIFDLDGTLIDSKLEVLSTYKKVISEIAPSQKFDETNIDYGANLNSVLSSIYKNETEKIAQAKQLFVSSYDNSNYDDALLYSGVIDVLTYLKSKNYNLFIATNKRNTPTIKLLETKKLTRFFTGIIGNEIEPGVSINKTKMIELLKAKHLFTSGFMIGDTIGDIEAGINNNLDTIAVLYGYGTLAELANLKPNYIINSITELTTIFD